LVLVGLEAQPKRRQHAFKLGRLDEQRDLQEALLRLQEMRAAVPGQLDSLSDEFISRVAGRGTAHAYAAEDSAHAAGYIGRIVGKGKPLAINRSGTIGELRPYLEADGHALVHTYLDGVLRGEGAEKVLHHYWQLPEILPETAYPSFNKQRAEPSQGRKEYAALLGVSGAAAEDGAVVFLQHTSNVSRMLQEARQLILVVGLDKIVPLRDDAILQAKCMGVFGLESVILNLSLPDPGGQALEIEGLPIEDVDAEMHVILLDNGRRDLAQRDEFAGLLTCISCQACAVQCPTHAYFNSQLGDTPKQYLWSFLLGMNPSLELCIGCGMCLATCPLGIDLPRMISTARSQALGPPTRAISNRLLQDAWLAMYGAHLSAPAANRVLNNRFARQMIERMIGFEHDAWVPSAQTLTFQRLFRQRRRERQQG
jgi:L-lactate utilization protein LutB